jgi:hypothetical protein
VGHDHDHPTEAVLLDVMLGEADPVAAAHVESCGPCREAVVALTQADTETAALLAALPPPGPMPPAVAARLDAALADEAALRAGVADGQVVALDARRARRAQRLTALLGAAAVVGLAAVALPPLLGNDGLAPGGVAGGLAENSAEDTAAAGGPTEAGVPVESPDALEAPAATEGTRTEGAVALGTLPPIPPVVLRLLERAPADAPLGPGGEPCGAPLAAALGTGVQAAAAVPVSRGGGVLVALDDGAVWWLPACTADADEALGRESNAP